MVAGSGTVCEVGEVIEIVVAAAPVSFGRVVVVSKQQEIREVDNTIEIAIARFSKIPRGVGVNHLRFRYGSVSNSFLNTSLIERSGWVFTTGVVSVPVT